MAVRSGVAASVGVAPESAWGTYVAPTAHFPFTSEGLRRENEYIRTAGLRAGRISQPDAQHVQTTRSAGGPLELDVLTKGMGKFLNLLHGDVVAPVQEAATTAYLQTHPIGLTDPYGKSLSIQVGRPDVGGTVRPFTYLGAKLMAATFNLERGGVLTSELEFDAKDETTAETLAAASYAANAVPFSFQQGSIELDDAVLTDCVRSASVGITLPHETDRYCINSSSVKKEPIVNGLVGVEATLECEFASLAQHTAFAASTRRKLELICTGLIIATTYAYEISFTIPATVTVGEGPVVEGPDVLTQELTLEATDNGAAAPLTVKYRSTDTAL